MSNTKKLHSANIDMSITPEELTGIRGLTVIGAGGGGYDEDDITARAGDVLVGKTTLDNSGELINGTIESKYTEDITFDAAKGEYYVPEKGYFPIGASIKVTDKYAGSISTPITEISKDSASHKAKIISSCTVTKAGVLQE